MPDSSRPLRIIVGGGPGAGKSTLAGNVAWRHVTAAHHLITVPNAPDDGNSADRAISASRADLAVLLMDVRTEPDRRTLHEVHMLALMGIDRIVVAVNKMDLVDYAETDFREAAARFATFAQRLGIPPMVCVPVSASAGANIASPSPAMPWFEGKPLRDVINAVQSTRTDGPLRMMVETVEGGRCSGTLASGRAVPGAPVRVLPGGELTTVARIVHRIAGEGAEAADRETVTVALADEVGVSGGSVLADPADTDLQVVDQFAAHLLWMDDHPMMPGRSYLVRLGSAVVPAKVTDLKHRIDVETRDHRAAKTLETHEFGYCNIALDRPLPFTPFSVNRALGLFLVFDRQTRAPVGIGTIDFALRRATNIVWQPIVVDKAARAGLTGQRPCVVWLTGLSASGKSTIANLVEAKLHGERRLTYLLDGDNVRHGLNRDLGFTEADRVENIRRVAEVAKLFVDAGIIVLVSFISPFRAERRMARELLGEGEFIEVFVDTPLSACEQRDPKGLYRKARSGALKNFTGIDSPYEPPEAPDLTLDTTRLSAEEAAERIVVLLRERACIW